MYRCFILVRVGVKLCDAVQQEVCILPNEPNGQDIRLKLMRPRFEFQFGRGGYALQIISNKDNATVKYFTFLIAKWTPIPVDE